MSGALSYDVGTLRAAAGSNLGPILEIASPQELASLMTGVALGMAGYPSEGISGGEVLPLGATPTYAAGMITSITDVFMMPAEQYSYISSRLIKEVFALGGRVHGLVPELVEERLRGKGLVRKT